MSSAILHRLQQLELELAEARQRLGEVARALEGGGPLDEVREREARLEVRLQELKARQMALDLELGTLSQKMSTEEERLYSGRVRNPKELQDLERELKYLSRTRGQLEERLLEAMLAVEDSGQALEAARQGREQAEEDWQRRSEELAASRTELQARTARLEQEAGRLRAQVEPDALQIYQELRGKRGGVAVALLRGSLCQGCGVANPEARAQEARRGDRLVFCNACGRILHPA